MKLFYSADRRTWFGIARLLLAGAFGGLIFYLLHLPLPWMLGSLAGALLVVTLTAVPIARPRKLVDLSRAILGVAIGAAFTPALLKEAHLYLFSLVLLPPIIALGSWAGMRYFERFAGFDRRTAFFSSLPGGLVEMTLISEACGADTRRVTLIHTTRILLIVYTVPFAIHHLGRIDLSGRGVATDIITMMPIDQALMLCAAALTGWWLMWRMRLPGASIIGPMLLSAILYASGLATWRLPSQLINGAQWILGASIACAFVNTGLREAAHAVAMTLGYFALLISLAMVGALAAHHITGVPLVATLLAFIPGGQAEMNVIALTVGIAIPYVALHHVTRMFLVMTVAPVLSSRLFGIAVGKNRK
ncbi:MAG: AbrB family transcriptional regulator [Candidatus Thiodiazotropha sp.]